MSEMRAEPAILAEDVWVNFLIRYHRAEVTLRETLVRLLDRFRKPRKVDKRWSQTFWALRGVSLEVRPGEVLGLIGRNGSGKTTLLKTLGGICQPDHGRVTVRGTLSCLMSFGIGFKPTLSGRENVIMNGSILGLSRKLINERMDAIIEFAELGDFIDAPIMTYSAGMRSRLGFSIAINIGPDILLLDEVLSTGDAAFRAKAGNILERFRDGDKTVIIATHSMDLVKNTCTRAVWLDQGQLRMDGAPEEVTAAYIEASKEQKRVDAAEAAEQKSSDQPVTGQADAPRESGDRACEVAG